MLIPLLGKYGLGHIPDTFDMNIRVLSLPPIAAADMPRRMEQIDGEFPIYDQSSDGACVGFTLKECAQIVLLNTQGKRVSLSAGFIWRQGKAALGLENRNSGCRISDAVAAMRRLGAPMEEVAPTIPGYYADYSLDAYENAKDHPLIDSEYVNTLLQAKTALLHKHPVAIGTALTASFEVKKDGLMPRPGGKLIGGHAMPLVAFDDDKQFGWAPPGGFKVRNHWTKDFGEDGWLWMPYSHFESQAVSDSYVIRVLS